MRASEELEVVESAFTSVADLLWCRQVWLSNRLFDIQDVLGLKYESNSTIEPEGVVLDANTRSLIEPLKGLYRFLDSVIDNSKSVLYWLTIGGGMLGSDVRKACSAIYCTDRPAMEQLLFIDNMSSVLSENSKWLLNPVLFATLLYAAPRQRLQHCSVNAEMLTMAEDDDSRNTSDLLPGGFPTDILPGGQLDAPNGISLITLLNQYYGYIKKRALFSVASDKMTIKAKLVSEGPISKLIRCSDVDEDVNQMSMGTVADLIGEFNVPKTRGHEWFTMRIANTFHYKVPFVLELEWMLFGSSTIDIIRDSWCRTALQQGV